MTGQSVTPCHSAHFHRSFRLFIRRCLQRRYRPRSRRRRDAASCPSIRRSRRRFAKCRNSPAITRTTFALTSTGTPSGRCERMYKLIAERDLLVELKQRSEGRDVVRLGGFAPRGTVLRAA